MSSFNEEIRDLRKMNAEIADDLEYWRMRAEGLVAENDQLKAQNQDWEGLYKDVQGKLDQLVRLCEALERKTEEHVHGRAIWEGSE